MTVAEVGSTNSRKTLALAIAAVLMSGCGGGGSGGGSSVGGIDGSGGENGPIASGGLIVSGPINGFGSVIVNGTAYETSGAEIYVDGVLSPESALEVGQVVQLSASAQGNGFTAERIVYDAELEGPVEAIDLDAESMIVLGQTVIINSRTSFDRDIPLRSLEGLSVGDFVEVSGYPNADRDTIATRIELEDDEEYELTGLVSELDPDLMTFMIRDLMVDYSEAELDDFDGRAIADGDLVEVEGDSLGSGGELLADSVELESRIFRGDFDDDDLDDREVEIEGFITRYESATDFDVSGVPVTTNSDTEYDDDGGPGNLALNVLVEVEGRFNGDGVLVAEEIEFEDDGQLEIEARVDAVDSAAGRITLLGIEVEITDETRMDDDDIRQFTIDDIGIGDWLEVTGYEREPGSNLVTAIQLEREDDSDDEASITGFVTDLAEPGFSILGLGIDTTSSTEFDDTGRSFFFANAAGRLAEVEGSYDGSRFLATQVELEDDDDDDD